MEWRMGFRMLGAGNRLRCSKRWIRYSTGDGWLIKAVVISLVLARL